MTFLIAITSMAGEIHEIECASWPHMMSVVTGYLARPEVMRVNIVKTGPIA